VGFKERTEYVFCDRRIQIPNKNAFHASLVLPVCLHRLRRSSTFLGAGNRQLSASYTFGRMLLDLRVGADITP
jgi:hypothetical protein